MKSAPLRRSIAVVFLATLLTNCDSNSSQGSSTEQASQTTNQTYMDSRLDIIRFKVPTFPADNAFPLHLADMTDYPKMNLGLFDAVVNLDWTSGDYSVIKAGLTIASCKSTATAELIRQLVKDAQVCAIPDVNTAPTCNLVAEPGYLHLYKFNYEDRMGLGSTLPGLHPDLGCKPRIDFCNPDRTKAMRELLKLLKSVSVEFEPGYCVIP